MGPIGLPEMMALFVIALLLFGPKKLPELGRTLGKGLSEFRRAKNELKATLKSHMQEIERETRIETPAITDSSHYTYPYNDYNQYDPDAPPPARQLTEGQQSAVAANAAEANPEAHGLPAVAGTVPRTNGVQPLSASAESVSHIVQHESAPDPVEEHKA